MPRSRGLSQSLATRANKEKLLRYLLLIKNERDINRLKYFKPNPGFQQDFQKSDARIRLIFSGNQAGKTTISMAEVALLALGCHPYRKIKTPNVGIIVSSQGFKTGIEKVVIPKLKEVVGSSDIRKISHNSSSVPIKIEWRNGSITHLMSGEQDDHVFEGMTVDYVAYDEPIRREIFIALWRGLMKSDGICWFACTPLDEVWIYEDLYMPGKSGKDPGIAVFEGTPDQNPYLSEEAKADFKKMLSEAEMNARWHGKAMHLSNRVFKTYNPERHRVPFFDIPSHWPVWVGIDPHKNKPHLAIFVAISPSNAKYCVNEIFYKCGILEFGRLILQIGAQYNVISRVIDPSSQEADWNRQTSARGMLASIGCETKLAYKVGQKKPGITLINQLFENNELYVTDNCLRLHRELMGQTYKKKKNSEEPSDEPEKRLDDGTDALRYVLTLNPSYRGRAEIFDHGPIFGKIMAS